MAKPDDAWFQSINWRHSCIECQRETDGTCSRRSCAEMHYDENGNYISPMVVGYDGDYKKIPKESEDSANGL